MNLGGAFGKGFLENTASTGGLDASRPSRNSMSQFYRCTSLRRAVNQIYQSILG